MVVNPLKYNESANIQGGTSPEQRFLIGVLRAFMDLQALPEIPSELNWNRLDHLSSVHKISPILMHTLQRDKIPEKIYQRWHALSISVIFSSVRAAKIAVRLFKLADEAGIPVAAVRGLPLAYQIYKAPELRYMTNVDLLIAAPHHDEFKKLLSRNGFEPAKFRRTQYVYHIDGSIFEVHWSLLTSKRYRAVFSAEEALTTRLPLELPYGRIYRLSNEYELLGLICHSFIHHDLARLLQLLDIALFIERPNIDWGWISKWGREKRLRKMMAFTLAIVNRLFKLESAHETFFPEILFTGLSKKALAAYQDRLFQGQDNCSIMNHIFTNLFVAEGFVRKFRQILKFFAKDERYKNWRKGVETHSWGVVLETQSNLPAQKASTVALPVALPQVKTKGEGRAHLQCQLCSGTEFKVLFNREFQVLLCKNCCLIFSHQTGRDFREYYTRHYDARLIARDRKKRRSLKIFRLKRWITRFAPDLHTVDLIEIGCGTGRLLEALQTQGAKVCGIEPGLRAADIAKGRIGEENVMCCMLADVSGKKQYDLIIMIQTLEHLEEPPDCLEKIKLMLRPKGLILIEVPNFFSLRGFFSLKQIARSYPSPNHLFVYTRRTLGALLNKAGFNLIALSSSFRNIRLVAQANAISTKRITVKTESYPRVYLFFLIISGVTKIKDIFRSLYIRVVDQK